MWDHLSAERRFRFVRSRYVLCPALTSSRIRVLNPSNMMRLEQQTKPPSPQPTQTARHVYLPIFRPSL